MKITILQSWLLMLLLPGLMLGTSCSDSSDGVVGSGGNVMVVSDDGTGDFDTLQEAVDAAHPGDLVQIRSGNYSERVVVDKNLTIIGDGPGAIISANGVPLLPGSLASDSAVLVVRDAFDVVIEDVSFTGPEDGVIVRSSSNVTLRKITASGNGGNGVDVRSSANVTVSGTFSGNGDHGVRVRDGSTDVVVESSLMIGNVDDGIRVLESSNVVVRDNESSQNGDHGIEVRDSTGVSLVGNTANNNAGFGIRIRDSDVLVENNTTVGNQEGDFFEE
jgi:parallel beta-helix repeat protein